MSIFRFVVFAAISLAVASPAVAQSASRTQLWSWPNPSRYNEPIVLRADVDGLGGGAPKGTVSFFDGEAPIGSGALSPYGAGQRVIASGNNHVCVLSVAGGVKCWGQNNYGQLGDGTSMDRPAPVDVVGLTSGVVEVAASSDSSCALTTAGAVKCWGELGWLDLSSLSSGVVAIAVGGIHGCALTTAGAVKCWGLNNYGQLGDGTTTSRSLPVAVAGLSSGVVAITAGWRHSCAVTSAGAVKCWGWNHYGQLGNGERQSRSLPVAVSGLSSGVVAVAAGQQHTCAVTRTGAVTCWGGNNWGQLGDGTQADRYTPVAVAGLSRGVAAITTGKIHSCALTGAGAAKCWGANDSHQLGDGTTRSLRLTPVSVSEYPSDFVALAAGSSHTCALTSAGSPQCWGHRGTIFGLTSLVRARAWLSIRTLRGGAHNLRARFPGDAAHAPSEATIVQKVR